MGREVRMVPAGWEHPKNERGGYIPLLKGPYEEWAAEWEEEKQKWDEGFCKSCESDEWRAREGDELETTFEEWYGGRPNRSYYMPTFTAGTATHFMMYETCSEGTPISPAFATPEKLALWLVDSGASSFGPMTASYEQWLRVASGGYAPSIVVDSEGLRSGVAL